MHEGSAEFAELWDAHTLELGEHAQKTMVHPEVGSVTVHCDMLAVPNRDQMLVTLAAESALVGVNAAFSQESFRRPARRRILRRG